MDVQIYKWMDGCPLFRFHSSKCKNVTINKGKSECVRKRIRFQSSLSTLVFTLLPPPPPSVAFGQHEGPHVTLHQCQPSLQQVQEPAGQHHAIRVNTSMSAAHQRGRGIRLHQRQLHRRVPVSKTHSLQKQQQQSRRFSLHLRFFISST